MARSLGDALTIWFHRVTRFRSGWPYLFGTILATAVLAVFVALIVLVQTSPDEERRSTPRMKPEQVDYKTFVNELGAYSFTYPEGWNVSRDGSVTRVRSPNRLSVASFGVDEGGGTVLTSFFRLQDMLLDRYRSASFRGSRTASWPASTAIVGRGRLVNSTGTRMRFLAASVQGTPHNYVIVAFQELGHASPGPKVALRRIVSSIEEMPSP
jgi:hypothetical protein